MSFPMIDLYFIILQAHMDMTEGSALRLLAFQY